MMSALKNRLRRDAVNYKGFRTKRKIIVIESDDWGAIRMPNPDVYNQLLKQGYSVDKCPYARNDSLACEEDLEKLFEVLTSYCDKNGNHPVLTANCVTANPDFKKIKESQYQEYFWESITETFKRYDAHEGSFELWKSGLKQNIFYPQFHGREHVNWNYWKEELQRPDSEFRKVFDYDTWVTGKGARIGKINPQAALDTETKDHFPFQSKYLQEGLDHFEKLFGYRSKSYIATNFIIHTDHFKTLSEKGVKYIQGMKYQLHPVLENKKRTMLRRTIGEKNNLNQHFLVRNCVFEPSQKADNFDSIGECLKDIQNAFHWKKPAIITAHRLNFIGYINSENRERNLRMLSQLFVEIFRKWPDVEFMTSPRLGKLIESGRSCYDPTQ
jgi:hypothetical protein